jgi:hypothetical protein
MPRCHFENLGHVSFDISKDKEAPGWNYCRIIRLLFKSEVKLMSNQSFGRGVGTEKSGARKTSDTTLSKASHAASEAAGKAKQAASETASSITEQVKVLLDEQVGNGADVVGHLADSAKLAAADLNRNAPQLAGLLQGVAQRLEDYAGDLQDQSVDQLWRSASNYTRRQPAVVFGLAALAGFFALRTFKSTPARRPSPLNQDQQSGQLSSSRRVT